MAPPDPSARLLRPLLLPLLASLALSAVLWQRRDAAPRGEAGAPGLPRLPRVQDGPLDGNVALVGAVPPRPGPPERPLRAVVGPGLSSAPLLLAAGGLEVQPGTPLAGGGLSLSAEVEDSPAARLERLRHGEADVALVPLDAWVAEPVGEPFLLAGWSRGLEGMMGRPGGRVGVVGPRGAWLWRALLSVNPGLGAPGQAVQLADAGEAARLLEAGALQATVGPLPAWPGAAPLATSADLPGGLAEVWVAAPGLRAQAPGALAALCAGAWDALSILAEGPAEAHRQLSGWVGRPVEVVRGELARLRLAGFADNALFFGLTGGVSTFALLAAEQSAVGLGAAPPVAAPGALVASLARAYRGHPFPRRWAVRERSQLSQRSLVGQPVLLHFEPGTRFLLPGDGLLLEGLGETLRQFPSAVLKVQGRRTSGQGDQGEPPVEAQREAWLREELRRGFGVAPGRLVSWEGPPGVLPPGEAQAAHAVQLEAR